MSVIDSLNSLPENFKAPGAKRRLPLWKGPKADGITYSMLSRFLVCRERFRLYAIEGLQTAEHFNHLIEYGHMFHKCEEAGEAWKEALNHYCAKLGHKYPLDRESIAHWQAICAAEYPIYLDYWQKNSEKFGRTVLGAEVVFKVDYVLPSGRSVVLKGRWDSLDRIQDKEGPGIYLLETKTKSSIDRKKLARQLRFDLQTMMYLIALRMKQAPGLWDLEHDLPVLGVRYNVIRRPAHKGIDSMINKANEDIAKGRAGEWFDRLRVRVRLVDYDTFCRECFNPILEQLCDWWEWITLAIESNNSSPFTVSRNGLAMHYRYPYGVYNILNEGGISEYDNYLESGSETGLTRVDSLFTELQ